jgi:hypothetical protein
VQEESPEWTRYSGAIFIIVHAVYNAEIVVISGSYKIHEAHLCFIAMETYIIINYGVDLWLMPIACFIGHTYLLIRFYLVLDDVPNNAIPGFYFPVVIQ